MIWCDLLGYLLHIPDHGDLFGEFDGWNTVILWDWLVFVYWVFFGFHEIQWWFSGGNECVSDSMVFFLVDCMVILSAISWFSRWCSLRCCNRTWQWEIPWWMGIEKWEYHLTGWWFQTCFLFSIIYGNNHPNWLRFFNWNIIYLLVNVYRKLWNISVFKFGKSTISMGHFQ